MVTGKSKLVEQEIHLLKKNAFFAVIYERANRQPPVNIYFWCHAQTLSFRHSFPQTQSTTKPTEVPNSQHTPQGALCYEH